jgi:hypothetical protein
MTIRTAIREALVTWGKAAEPALLDVLPHRLVNVAPDKLPLVVSFYVAETNQADADLLLFLDKTGIPIFCLRCNGLLRKVGVLIFVRLCGIDDHDRFD